MRVVNKDKQARSEDKKTSARLIRRSSLEPETTPSKTSRQDQNACPVCGERVEKAASGGRRKQQCAVCGATRNKLLTCESCGTQRVWQGKKGAACRGCGHRYETRKLC